MTVQLSDYSGGKCLTCGNECHRRRIRCAPCGNKSKMVPAANRFWRRVAKTAGCWLWTGSTTPGGYGKFYFKGKHVYAHRFSYQQSKGAIPDGLNLDHLCRTPKCVNPDHLEAVTQAVNMYRSMIPNFITMRRNRDTCARV